MCNDTIPQLINLFNTFKTTDSNKIFKDILNIIEKYNLSDSTKNSYEDYGCNSSKGLGKYNKEAYLKLRNDYNLKENSYNKDIFLYVLLCYSFSNQMRFNKKGGFNMPYGKRDFNKNIRNNLKEFLNKLHNTNIKFTNKDFKEFKNAKFSKDDFVYCDPPYLISTATYNESGGWTKQDELDLYNFLDDLNNKDIKFALSNVLEHKGKVNDLLKGWASEYTIHYLSADYSNCNYQVKSKKRSVEVLVVNY